MLVCICVEFAEIVCVYVGGVVDVVECGLFFESGLFDYIYGRKCPQREG